MEINAPMGNNVPPQYNEGSKLASSRDTRNNAFLWKKGDNTSSQVQSVMEAVQKMNREMGKMRRRIVGGFAPTDPIDIIHPFQIYNIENTSGGKNGLTFQIRDGIVSARSRFWKNGYSDSVGTYNPALQKLPGFADGQFGSPDGNFETYLSVYQDYQGQYFANGPDTPDGGQSTVNQPSANVGASVTMSQTQDTLISGYDSGGNRIDYAQIIAPDLTGQVFGTNGGSIAISFWVEIIDDPVLGFYANLWGRFVNLGGFIPATPPAAVTAYLFPNRNAPTGASNTVAGTGSYGANIIPIGAVQIGYDDTDDVGNQVPLTYNGKFIYSQFACDNVLNRFPAYPISYNNVDAFGFSLMGQPMTYRGSWTAQNLANQVFYPGDVVIDDTTPAFSISGHDFYAVYYYNRKFDAINFEPDPPSAHAGRWEQIGLRAF